VPTLLAVVSQSELATESAARCLRRLGPLAQGAALDYVDKVRRMNPFADGSPIWGVAWEWFLPEDPAASAGFAVGTLEGLRKRFDDGTETCLGQYLSAAAAAGIERFHSVVPIIEPMFLDPRRDVREFGARFFTAALRSGWQGRVPVSFLPAVADTLDSDEQTWAATAILTLAVPSDPEAAVALIRPVISSDPSIACSILRNVF
jgi:hypothetical protein